MARSLRLVKTDSAPSPEDVLEANILQGFLDMHAGRHHAPATGRGEVRKVLAFRTFVDKPMWDWCKRDMDRYSKRLQERDAALETLRANQGAVKRISDYARDPGYDWDEQCFALTGKRIPQICTRENTAPHQHDARTSKRRNLSNSELDRFFTTVHSEIANAPRQREKLARNMHYAVLATGLGTGGRAHEIEMCDRADLAAAVTPEIAAYSSFEDLHIRFGKSHDGGPPTQRHVPFSYLFRDCVSVLERYLQNVRPLLELTDSDDAIFLNARGGRFRSDSMSAMFRHYADLAGLSPDLTFHCLRHTFETKLRESGLEVAIISLLMGHELESTTLLYDHLGSPFLKQRMLVHNRSLLKKSNQCRQLNGVYAH